MEFREVTPENLKEVIALKVHPHQENLVADNLYSVAQVGLKDGGWCRAAYVDDAPSRSGDSWSIMPTRARGMANR